MTEESLFAEALEKDPAQRNAFLDKACGTDGDLRRRVESLLQCHEKAERFLQQPALEQIGAGEADPFDWHPETAGDQTMEPAHAQHASVLQLLESSGRPGALGRLKHYHVMEVLGQGGFGTVLKVFDDRLHRVVAIKVLAPELAANATARQRFLREARAAAAVRHDNIIDIHVVDEDPIPHLVMEYIDGPTLQQKLQRSGPLPVTEILRIGMQIAEGLAAAHKQGLIHRDIKPSNILLENGVERVKISDFGLARAVDDASLTQSGLIAGTPQYMSPEQAEGKTVDQRSDLFSLGSVLYALATGHPPFRADSTMAVLRRVCEDTPRPIVSINSEIPAWLDAIIARLHAKAPADRFQSARDLAELLAKHLARLQQPQSADVSATASAVHPVAAAPAPETTVPARQGPQLILASILVVAVVTLAAYLAISLNAPDENKKEQVKDLAAIDSFAGRRRDEIPPVLLTQMGNGDPAQAPAELVAVLADSAFRPTLPGVNSVAYSPDGRFVANTAVIPGKEAGEVQIWDAASGRLLHTFHGIGLVENAVFSRDSKRLASAGRDGMTRIWDVAGGKEILSLKNDQVVRGLAFNPDNSRLAVTSDAGPTKIWDLGKSEVVLSLEGHEKGSHDVVWSVDGKRIATCGADGTARTWDASTGNEVAVCRGHTFPWVRSIAFSPDGKRIVTASQEDPVARVWDADTGKELMTLKGHTQRTRQVAWSRDGSTIATGGEYGKDCTVKLWDAQTGREIKSLKGHTGPITHVGFHPDGKRLVSGGLDGTLRFWNIADGTEILSFQVGHFEEVQSLAFSKDGRTLASGGQDKTVKIWDLAGWKKEELLPPVRTFKRHTDRVGSLAFGRDGKQLASASADGTVILWEVAGGKEVRTLTGCSRQWPSVAFSPDGGLLAAISRDNNSARLLNMESGKPKEALSLNGGLLRTLAFHPSEKLLAFGGEDNQVGLCEVDADRVQHVFETKGKVLQAVFSSDGGTLAAITDAPDSALYCWDVVSRKQLGVLRGQTGPVRALAIQPGSRLIATGNGDGNISFWQMPKEEANVKLTAMNIACQVGVNQLAFTPNGRYLAVAGGKGLIAILRVPPLPDPYSPGPARKPPTFTESADKPSPADALKFDNVSPVLLQKAFPAPAKAPAGLVTILAEGRFLLPPGSGGIMRMDRSSDGKFLAIPRGNDLIVLDASSGKYMRTLEGPGGHMRRAVFSPDSKLLAALAWDGDNKNLVRVWDVANEWKILDRQPLPPQLIDYLTFSGDSKTIITSSNAGQPIHVADARTGEKVQTIKRGGDFFAILSGGKYLAAADWNSRKVILWDTNTGKEHRTFERNMASVGNPALSPDGKVLAMGSDTEVKLCQVETGETLHTLKTVGHQVTFTPDGKTLFTWATVQSAAAHTVTRWDVDSGKKLGQFTVTGPVDLFFPCLSHDGKHLYLTYPQSRLPYVKVFDAETGKERPHRGHTGQVHGVAISPNGELLASAGVDLTVRLWNLGTGELRQTLMGHPDGVRTVAFSPDSKLLASAGDDRTVRIWDALTGKELHTLAGHKDRIRQVAFAPDGKSLASAGMEGAARLWDPITGKLLRCFSTAGPCGCVAFSPDGKTLAAGDGKVIRLWNLSTGWSVAALSGHADLVCCVAFHPDGQSLASSADHADSMVRLWDLTSLKERQHLEGHTAQVLTALWRPDGKVLMTCGGVDGTLRFWDMTESPPQAKVVPILHSGPFLSGIAQTREGRYLATANPDGTVFVIRLGESAKKDQ